MVLVGAPYSTTITLEKDNLVTVNKSLCGESRSKQAYGEISGIDKSTFCCFSCVGGDGLGFCPGLGCDYQKVDEVVHALQEKIKTRGDAAQLKRSEEQGLMLRQVNAKLDAIMKHLNIPTPEVHEDKTPFVMER